jgi:hypothetical protein
MIRPWMGVLPVVLGLALLPSAAMAQGAPAPTITIATPAQGGTYKVGEVIAASYSCTDPSGPVTDCTGTVPHGSNIDTAAAGSHTFTVTSHNSAGSVATETRTYSVEPVSAPVGGDTPPTLNLTLGTPASFSPFIPGLSRDYTVTMTASITSTAENATLSVADPSATATSRLVNGAFSLQSPLQASASSTLKDPNGAPLTQSAPIGPVGNAAQPQTLLTYNSPVGLDNATLTFKQTIAETEALRTGGYSKTLTFTLSTTNP